MGASTGNLSCKETARRFGRWDADSISNACVLFRAHPLRKTMAWIYFAAGAPFRIMRLRTDSMNTGELQSLSLLPGSDDDGSGAITANVLQAHICTSSWPPGKARLNSG